jgi:DNA end-binding protein Ku
MWRGAIQFGLVTIPVRLYLATESRGGLSFNLLHKEAKEHGRVVPCLRRIQMKTHCPEHGEIPRTDTVRGYEWSKGQYVVMDETDFEAVPLRTVRAIEIEQFVAADTQGEAPIFVKQAYYLEPEPIGRKAFSLLRAVLAEEGLKGVCKIVLKDREQLSVLDPYQKTMLLSTIYWPDEVRDLGELELPTEEFEAKPAEVAMAKQLVSAMTGAFEPERYHDAYREALLTVIEAKVDGQEITAPEPVVETRGLTDLMAVLEASVAAARASRAETSQAEEQPAATSKAAGGSKAASGSKAKPKAAAQADQPIPVGRARRTATKTSAATSATAPDAEAAAPQRRRKSA